MGGFFLTFDLLSKRFWAFVNISGRPGLKDDFVRFEAEARKKRRAQAVAAEKKKQKILEWTVGIVAVVVGLVGLAIALWLIGKGQGKW